MWYNRKVSLSSSKLPIPSVKYLNGVIYLSFCNVGLDIWRWGHICPGTVCSADWRGTVGGHRIGRRFSLGPKDPKEDVYVVMTRVPLRAPSVAEPGWAKAMCVLAGGVACGEKTPTKKARYDPVVGYDRGRRCIQGKRKKHTGADGSSPLAKRRGA